METKQEEEMDMLLALLELARNDQRAAGISDEVGLSYRNVLHLNEA